MSGASSCRCIGIAGCIRYHQGSFTRSLWLFANVKWEGASQLSLRTYTKVEAYLGEVPIPNWTHWQSIGYYNFNWAGTNSDMTHFMVLSAKVRRNGRYGML